MTKINKDRLATVAAEIEVILLREELALEPFIHRSIQADTASVRLVSTKKEEVDEKLSANEISNNVKKGTDKTKAKGAGDKNGATGTVKS